MAIALPNTISNTAAFAQYRRGYNAVTTTANTTYTSSPTNTALLYVAGPDGSIITKLASVPRATTAGTIQMQLFRSRDGGTTFTFENSATLPNTTLNQSTQLSGINFTQIDGTLVSETNPIALTGQTAFYNTVSTTPVQGGTSQGAANVQTLPQAIGVSALSKGLIVDFEAGLTNTSTATLTVGTSAATNVVRDYNGASLSAGDITAGFRYRVWYDGSAWRLVVTDRLYVAQGITVANGVVTSAYGADF